MRRTTALETTFVEALPATLLPRVLYVSGNHNIAAHLCCCGCGTEVVTPLGPAGWTLLYDGSASLTPSIGNGSLPCRSHYIIDHNVVCWLGPMTPGQHAHAKASDVGAAAALNRPVGRKDRLIAMFRSAFAPRRG